MGMAMLPLPLDWIMYRPPLAAPPQTATGEPAAIAKGFSWRDTLKPPFARSDVKTSTMFIRAGRRKRVRNKSEICSFDAPVRFFPAGDTLSLRPPKKEF